MTALVAGPITPLAQLARIITEACEESPAYRALVIDTLGKPGEPLSIPGTAGAGLPHTSTRVTAQPLTGASHGAPVAEGVRG